MGIAAPSYSVASSQHPEIFFLSSGIFENRKTSQWAISDKYGDCWTSGMLCLARNVNDEYFDTFCGLTFAWGERTENKIWFGYLFNTNRDS